MKVLVDANFLIYLIDRRDGGTQLEKDRRAKVLHVLESVENGRGVVIIPTPVLTEYLTNARSASQPIYDRLRRHRRVRIAAFDEVCAQEAALMHRAAWDLGGHKRFPLPETDDYQRIKVDWQIAAIAKVHGARMVTNDGRLARVARQGGLFVDLIDELPLPAGARQMPLEGVPLPPPTQLLLPEKAAPSKRT